MDANVKRLALSAVAGATVMALVAGGTFALFRDSKSATANYASGTVTLDAAEGLIVDISNIAPGWGLFWSDHQEWPIQYTGSLDAWVALDAQLTGALAACDGGHSFDAWLSTNHYGWTVMAGDGDTRTNMFPTYMTSGATDTYYLWPTLWPSASNDCQNKRATLELTAHAVQAYRNTNPFGTGPVIWDANALDSIDSSQIAQDLTAARQQFEAAHPVAAPSQTKSR